MASNGCRAHNYSQRRVVSYTAASHEDASYLCIPRHSTLLFKTNHIARCVSIRALVTIAGATMYAARGRALAARREG